MNQTRPAPSAGWAFPATHTKGAPLPAAHFYQPDSVRPLCGGKAYLGQQLLTTLRNMREACPTCRQYGQRLGMFK